MVHNCVDVGLLVCINTVFVIIFFHIGHGDGEATVLLLIILSIWSLVDVQRELFLRSESVVLG